MIKKIVITIIALIGLLFWAVFGAAVYALRTADVEYIIIGAIHNSFRIKRIDKACEYSLYYLRDTKQDVETMKQGSGLGYILSPYGDKNAQHRVAEFFIVNGLDVNRASQMKAYKDSIIDNGFTPLHLSVMDNNINNVRFLLKHGAKTDIKSKLYDMTPLEYAQFEHDKHSKSKNDSEDRSEIIQLLTSETLNHNQ